jgi:muramoyltetrapeptide carboxypeptidase
MEAMPLVRPTALREGDCIGLAAPASPFREEALYKGIGVLQEMGFRVRYEPRVFERYRYLAGRDAERAAELQSLFADPDIKAIFCCRGGYGSQRLLPFLDAAAIRANPKLFMGYSDLTSLLCYLDVRCGLAALHGPVVCGDLRPELSPAVRQQLLGVLIGDMEAMQPPASCQDGLTVLHAGEAEGRLLGGCLSVFACAIGTPFQPRTRGAILFLEDSGERLYAVDRLLTTLKLSGLLQGVRGLVFGHMDRVEADAELPYDAKDVIVDVLDDLGIPILYGFPSGHCPQPLTLPFGVRAAIRGGRLVLCESPVTTPRDYRA